MEIHVNAACTVPTLANSRHAANAIEITPPGDQQPFICNVAAQVNAGNKFQDSYRQRSNADKLNYVYQRQSRSEHDNDPADGHSNAIGQQQP